MATVAEMVREALAGQDSTANSEVEQVNGSALKASAKSGN
jgi:hypothetical protein